MKYEYKDDKDDNCVKNNIIQWMYDMNYVGYTC